MRQLDELPKAQDLASSAFALLSTSASQGALDEVRILTDSLEGTANRWWMQLDNDPEIQGLMKQLHGHLQNMQTNTGPLAGLSDAITRSQAALDLYSVPDD